MKRQYLILAVTTALTVVAAVNSPLLTSVQGNQSQEIEVDEYLGEYDEESYPIGKQIEEFENHPQPQIQKENQRKSYSIKSI